MAGVAGETDNSLAIQCMEFTKHLASEGKCFKFSLSMPSGFDFSLDVTQEKLAPSKIIERKKQSPSTLKRNALRKKTTEKELGQISWPQAS